MRIIALLVLAVSLPACENKLIGEMNDDLDSLESEMAKVTKTIAEVDAQRINDLLDTISFDMDYLELYLEQDTLPRELAITIGSYADLTRNFTKWKNSYGSHTFDIEYTSNQLKSLREDVNNGLVPKELFDEYKPSESKAVAQLSESSSNIVVWYESNLKRYDYLKAKVDSIVGKQVQ